MSKNKGNKSNFFIYVKDFFNDMRVELKSEKTIADKHVYFKICLIFFSYLQYTTASSVYVIPLSLNWIILLHS